MLGKTHMATGVATSLVILHPTTATGIVSAVVGGTIGGLYCDIDHTSKDPDDPALDISISDLLFLIVMLGVTLCADYLMGNGLCAFFTENFGVLTIFSLVVIIILTIIGSTAKTKHRGFTHSLVAMFVLSSMFYIGLRPLALPFLIGFASHILLDLTNYRKIRIFWPAPPITPLKLCKSNGTANDNVFRISFLVTAVAIPVLLLFSVRDDSILHSTLESISNGSVLLGLNQFQIYFIVINIVGLLFGLIAGLKGVEFEDSPNLLRSISIACGLAGGAIGQLLAHIITAKSLDKNNITRFTIDVSLFIIWVTLYCIICDPFGFGFEFGRIQGQENPYLRLALLIYLLFVNVLNFILFFSCKDNKFHKLNIKEVLMLFLGLAGGSLGGIICMIITQKKWGSKHFSIGLFVLLAAWVLVIGYLMASGVI